MTLGVAAQMVAAKQSQPMELFVPYVGSWSCTEKVGGEPARVSVFRFTMDHELLRETIVTPGSAMKPQGESTSAAFGFDAKADRYVEIEMISGGHWYASRATTPGDGVFHWADVATSETSSRWDMTLPQRAAFDIQSFSRPQDKTPSYRASCKRIPQ